MGWRPQINDRGVIIGFRNPDTGEGISAREYQRRVQMMQGGYTPDNTQPGIDSGASSTGAPMAYPDSAANPAAGPTNSLPATTYSSGYPVTNPSLANQAYTGTFVGTSSSGRRVLMSPDDPYSRNTQYPVLQSMPAGSTAQPMNSTFSAPAQSIQSAPVASSMASDSPLIQPGAQVLNGNNVSQEAPPAPAAPAANTQTLAADGLGTRLEGVPGRKEEGAAPYHPHGFLDATSIAIVLPTLILVALSIAAAHKKRLFPWQTIRTFSPPSGLMAPNEYEKSFLCPPNLRRHGRMGKRNPNATWTDSDGVVLPFGFLARTHLPITIPLGRLPNKNMFIVAPTGSGKTTLMRAIIKALMAKPCVLIALEAKANDPHLDEKKEGFKYTLLPEARAAGFDTLYFNPLDNEESIHWNPLDVAPVTFASSIIQDINRLAPEEQHWAERDHGYISGLTQLLKWGAVQVAGEDEEGFVSDVSPLPCNPRGLMRLVNNRRNIVESLRRLKDNPDVDPAELSELTQTLASIIRTDTDWDKNIQGVRGRLRMFKNQSVVRVTEQSNVDIQAAMFKPTVLIFGAPASLGPDAESLAACFVYQLQQALHTRYGIASILPLFAFFDEYQTLNLDIAGRLSAIVRGANGGLTVILQNISQITSGGNSKDPTSSGASELKTIFSNAAMRICMHNADESTSRFFSDEIGKHAVIVPGISDHFQSSFGTFPVSWNRIHSQQVVPRVDPDSIKRMERHHALVYLSPAGDAEFGEVKPFMVDLRGIEEIARMHLLYSIPGRQPTPGEPAGSAPSTPPTHIPWQANPGQSSWTKAAFESATRTTEANQAAQLQSTQATSSPVASTTSVGKLADTLAGAFPGIASAGTMSDAVESVLAGQQQSQSMPGLRLCPNCKQPAANKKFCTSCGTFMGEPTATTAAAPTNTPANAPQNTTRSASGKQVTPPPFPFAAGSASGQNLPGRDASWAGVKNSLAESELNNFDQPLPRAVRQSHGYTPEDYGQTAVAPRKPITSLNSDLNRPIPKQ